MNVHILVGGGAVPYGAAPAGDMYQNSGIPQQMNSGVPQQMNSGVPQQMNSGVPQQMNSGNGYLGNTQAPRWEYMQCCAGDIMYLIL